MPSCPLPLLPASNKAAQMCTSFQSALLGGVDQQFFTTHSSLTISFLCEGCARQGLGSWQPSAGLALTCSSDLCSPQQAAHSNPSCWCNAQEDIVFSECCVQASTVLTKYSREERPRESIRVSLTTLPSKHLQQSLH